MESLSKNLVFISVASLFFFSCSKDLNIRDTAAVAQSSLQPSDIAQLRTGTYSTVQNTSFSYYVDFDVRGQNLAAGPGAVFINNLVMTPSASDVQNLWQSAYICINNINFLIASISALPSSTQLSGYLGEALFFRALNYYNLVTRWGGVPIVLTNTYAAIQRSAEADVWNQIKADLTASRALIPAYSSNYYVSDQAVKALMARVYLATGDNTNAALYADSVINSGKFALATDSTSYSSIFITGATSKEIILAFANNNSGSTNLLYGLANDTKATWTYSPFDSAYNNLYLNSVSPVIKSGDVRKSAVFTADKTRSIKYSNGKAGQELVAASSPTAEPIVMFRLSEMYLIAAEAQGATAGASTLSTFMAMRYKTPPAAAAISSLSPTQYQTLILDERHREFYEEGQWWYDVKRTNRTDFFYGFNGQNYLLYYPVPQSEIDIAGYAQNMGY